MIEMISLMQVLRARLIESGWRDEMKEVARDTIRNHGLSKVTVDELVNEMLPRGKAAIPENIKKELLESVRDFVRKDINGNHNSFANIGVDFGSSYGLGGNHQGFGGTSEI